MLDPIATGSHPAMLGRMKSEPDDELSRRVRVALAALVVGRFVADGSP
jgi:hypothetical protein